MRWLAIPCLALATLVATPVLAQDDGDEGRIVRFLEDQLSLDGERQVDIQGFRGALSSTAELDRLVISDADGPWLTLENATLNWSRSELLRGRLSVRELTATRIEISRPPLPADTGLELPSAEATPFSLPDLPVSINVERFAIDAVVLGDAFLGMEVQLSVEGNAELADGEGAAILNLQRLDGPRGLFELAAQYDNETRNLDLSLVVEEDPDGLAAELLGLPGGPAIRLTVAGDGPIDDFAADIDLATDDQPRLTGRVTTQVDATTGERVTLADLRGDISPLFLPDYQEFFGPRMELTAYVSQPAGGGVSVRDLTLEAAALSLAGTLDIDAEGVPQAFDLVGRVAAPDGEPIRLPVPGAAITLQNTDLVARYNASEGDAFEAEFVLEGLDTGDLQVGELTLHAGGTITSGEVGLAISSGLDITMGGLSHRDAALGQAIGEAAALSGQVSWREDAPVVISDLAARSGDVALRGDASVSFAENRIDVTLDTQADVADLDRFAAVAGQPLDGSVSGRLSGTAEPLSGAFDLRLEGGARDLRIADALPPELLAGETTLTIAAKRDATGFAIETLDLSGSQISLTASGAINARETTLEASARLADVSLFTGVVEGPATVDLILDRAGDGPFMTQARVTGPQDLGLTLAGSFTLPEADFDITLDASVSDVPLPDTLPAALLAGETTLRLIAQRLGSDIRIASLDLSGQQIDLTASGQFDLPDPSDILAVQGSLQATARLADVGLFTDAITGPVSVDLSASRDTDGPWSTEADLRGPLGINADVSGEIDLPDNQVDLRANGSLPLALANRVLQPRSLSGTLAFDLAVEGAPGLDAVSGDFSASGVRVTLPSLQNALEDVTLTGRLAGGQVAFDSTGRLSTGGSLSANGTVGIVSSSLPARISVRGSNLQLIDPTLYTILVQSAEVSVNGALAGSMQVTGDVVLGESEIRVPEGGAGSAAPIPEIRHIGETARERQTRMAAGLIRTDGPQGSQRIGLDVTVTAPGRIFIRGRGLDAEMGGALQIGGTTANIIPSGRFELLRGRLSILGTRLDLNEGSASLQGSFDPFIRLLASSRAGGHTINIGVIGPASRPDISITSDPGLPEDEILAQLLFGRSVSALSPIQLLQMADAAASLAGGGSDAGIFANLRENLGLDDLDIQTDETGNAALRAGRYLSENIYADVTVGTDETDLSLNIDLTPNITARGSFSSDGSSSVGVFYERDY